MQSLVDLQSALAQAMTSGEARVFDVELIGGAVAQKRLRIHLRHYEISLTAALLDKFPACAWLAGSDLLRDAARTYARLHPPHQPCIAEYGRDFPRFLAGCGRAAALPYLESFGALEWAFSQASIATDSASLAWTQLCSIGPDRLVDSTLALQRGLHYCDSRWRIDELMATYLSGAEAERFVLVESSTFMEIHGARGTVSLQRLEKPAFVFRVALADGRSIGDAATAALECDAAFDAGTALKALADARLVTGLSAAPKEPGTP